MRLVAALVALSFLTACSSPEKEERVASLSAADEAIISSTPEPSVTQKQEPVLERKAPVKKKKKKKTVRR